MCSQIFLRRPFLENLKWAPNFFAGDFFGKYFGAPLVGSDSIGHWPIDRRAHSAPAYCDWLWACYMVSVYRDTLYIGKVPVFSFGLRLIWEIDSLIIIVSCSFSREICPSIIMSFMANSKFMWKFRYDTTYQQSTSRPRTNRECIEPSKNACLTMFRSYYQWKFGGWLSVSLFSLL